MREISNKNKISFNKEPILDFNGFDNPLMYEDMEALAQTIRNIILVEKGTYPNTPDFGVGINNYLFEILDSITISEISTEIQRQIAKYIVADSVEINVMLERINKEQKDLNALAVSITLYDNMKYRIARSEGEEEEDGRIDFSYLFAANTGNKRTISKIIT